MIELTTQDAEKIHGIYAMGCSIYHEYGCCCPCCKNPRIIHPEVRDAAANKWQEMIDLLKVHDPENIKWIKRMEEAFDRVIDFLSSENDFGNTNRNNPYPYIMIEMWPNGRFYPLIY